MTRSRYILKRTGLRIWNNKKLSEMTDEECEECLRFIQDNTGIYYF